MLKYKNRKGNDFYNQQNEQLYGFDQIKPLEECPIPLVGSADANHGAYEVVEYAQNARHGYLMEVVVVKFVSSCGHEMLERVEFDENVKDFDHYGTMFYGADYSIKNYRKRIETFRNFGCDVCKMVRHHRWHLAERIGFRNRKKAIESLERTLNYNYENWKDYFQIENF